MKLRNFNLNCGTFDRASQIRHMITIHSFQYNNRCAIISNRLQQKLINGFFGSRSTWVVLDFSLFEFAYRHYQCPCRLVGVSLSLSIVNVVNILTPEFRLCFIFIVFHSFTAFSSLVCFLSVFLLHFASKTLIFLYQNKHFFLYNFL